jgi:hypothetical protein
MDSLKKNNLRCNKGSEYIEDLKNNYLPKIYSRRKKKKTNLLLFYFYIYSFSKLTLHIKNITRQNFFQIKK